MKIEWLTVKGPFLYAGGHGVVRHVNWKDVFTKIRNFAGFKAPGYLTHEAVHWSDIHKKWFFLPRKASTTMYEEVADEKKGTNMLITADENFNSFEVVKVGNNNHPERGFSAFAFVPGTNDGIIMAIKSKEVTGEDSESFATVFDTRGNIIKDDQNLGSNYKFEGIFLAT
ncbi:Apyrase, partial [Ancylostoma duodenale]